MPDKFPLPRIENILDQLGRAKFFTTLDLMAGFHQIPLDEDSRRFTHFQQTLDTIISKDYHLDLTLVQTVFKE